MKIFLLSIFSLLILTCNSGSPTSPSEDTNQEDCEDGVVLDECGVCGGQGPITTYVEDCGYEYVCGWETVNLGSDSYCTNSCVNGQYCWSSTDCHSGSNITLGCDQQGYYCVTSTQDYQCGNEYICDGEYITTCP